MTRKNYVAIAAALARTRPWDGPLTPELAMDAPERRWFEQWRVTRDAIIGVLQHDNPAFDRVRFIQATEA